MERQVTNIELIASANFVYESVLEGQGSILTNKIVEGYLGKRYYAGSEYIDEIEKIAIGRANLEASPPKNLTPARELSL